MKTVLLVVSLVAVALAGAPKRQWKAGTLMETAHAATPPGGPVAIAGPISPAAAIWIARSQRSVPWQGFRIEGSGYSFMVMCPVRRNHTPNVTVHGPIQYVLENGRFYMLDDDGKEWEMTVLEKALLPPPPAAPPQP